jgi:protein PhnA
VRFLPVRKTIILFLYEQTWLPDVRDDRRSGISRQMGMRHFGHGWPGEAQPDAPEAARVVKDAHGNVLADGDCVILIKDLKLGGGNQVFKGGTKSKPIRLVDGDHEIDCKMDGMSIGLKACFVKKA